MAEQGAPQVWRFAGGAAQSVTEDLGSFATGEVGVWGGGALERVQHASPSPTYL